MSHKRSAPIAIIIFNRPKCTRRVMEAVRQARPSRLFIIADGPRKSKAGEELLCAETREVVERMIDWPCEVVKDYSDENLGCGTRLPTGLTNMFKQVDRAIILEDDVLPDLSFFAFAEAMLCRYVDEPRVMQICGYNRFKYRPNRNENFFFSRYSDIWGWATWRRAWRHFDELNTSNWESVRASGEFENACFSLREAEMRKYSLDMIFGKRLDAWGMRWDAAKLLACGLGVVPSINLVSNIGFGADASHTVNPFNRNRFIQTKKIDAPYEGPAEIVSDVEYDKKYNRSMFSRHVAIERFRAGLLRIMGKA